MARNFLVPDSMASSYVASRSTNGQLDYEGTANQLDLKKQAALQNLNETYSATVNNAYQSYIAENQNVMSSALGEGFKQQYLDNQKQNLLNSLAEANVNAQSYRQQLSAETEQNQQLLQSAFTTEVTNLDRAIGSMEDYFTYLKSAVRDTGEKDAEGNTIYSSYLADVLNIYEEDLNKLTVNDLYEELIAAQPQSYKTMDSIDGTEDTESISAMAYTQWLRGTLGTNNDDEQFRKWFYGQGGYNELKEALKTVEKSNAVEQAKQKKLDKEKQDKEKQESENKKNTGSGPIPLML